MRTRDILATYTGKCNIVFVPENTAIPEGLVLIHEHGDHFSLQTTVSITPASLNKKMTTFLASFKRYTKDEYFEKFPINEWGFICEAIVVRFSLSSPVVYSSGTRSTIAIYLRATINCCILFAYILHLLVRLLVRLVYPYYLL